MNSTRAEHIADQEMPRSREETRRHLVNANPGKSTHLADAVFLEVFLDQRDRLDEIAVQSDNCVSATLDVRDAILALRKELMLLHQNRDSYSRPKHREKIIDFGLTVGTVAGFCLGVGAIGTLLAHIVDEIRQNDRRHVRLVYDPETKQMRPALVYDSGMHPTAAMAFHGTEPTDGAQG